VTPNPHDTDTEEKETPMTMTLQEYFDRAVKHLHSLPHRATNPDSHQCEYLTPDGLKCIVGAFIPDGHPAQFWKGGVTTLIDQFPDLAGVAWPDSDNGRSLAFDLQVEAHDPSSNWKADGFARPGVLIRIANKYGLNTDVVTARRWPK
jgi:hypothetical protein